MKLALRIGLTPREFEHVTPRELYLMAKTRFREQKDEAEARRVTAWNTAVSIVSLLGASLDGKKLSFEDVFGDTAGDGMPQEMSEEQMLGNIYAFVRAFGGDINGN